MKKVILFSAALLMVFAAYSQSYLVKFNFKKGKEYTQNVSSNIEIIQEVSGQQMQINMGVSATTIFKVIKVKDTLYDMDVKYANMLMKMKMSGQENSPILDDLMGKMLRQIEGRSFQMTISASGKIISIKNMNELFSHIFDSLTSLSLEEREQFKTQFAQAYGESAFKSSFSSTTSFFPNYAIKIGDEWTNNNKIESNYTFNVVSKYQLIDVDKKYYYFTAKSNLNTVNQSDSAFQDVNGMLIRVLLSGNAESTYKLDKKTGWIVECVTKQQLRGSTEIKETEAFKGGMKIPLRMNQTTTISN